MIFRWFPWRYVVSRVARARGLVDPVRVLSRLESFAQPFEVKEPLELLRAGMVLHARGLLNTGAIQHNLDWVWPLWVERQYDPLDDAFIPRAFSITHVNLTHRNWTAVGIPDYPELPLVDPCGLVTPFWDGWSLDFWFHPDAGAALYPSRCGDVTQELDLSDGVAVETRASAAALHLRSRVRVEEMAGGPTLRATVAGGGECGWLAASLRPFNPEGVSFVEEVSSRDGGWQVGAHRIGFDPPADRILFSDYRRGDVASHLSNSFGSDSRAKCKVGMATAAALFRVDGNAGREVTVEVPLDVKAPRRTVARPTWQRALDGVPELRLPLGRWQNLYEIAIRTLVLHSPGEVYPGPFTYKRFWFRDASFILNGLLALGLHRRAERALDSFPSRQKVSGHFFSQDGEWDSNGEALWILDRWCRLTGQQPKVSWIGAIGEAVRWIERKRVRKNPDSPHAGLLPAGFSAEHLGPNDYYYWDDFWSIAGLEAAARMLRMAGRDKEAALSTNWADDLRTSVTASLDHAAARLGCAAMPASPYRRLDCGAIGSLAAGYPLQLYPPDDERLLETAAYLLDTSLVGGAFFQDMIHSGINPYLTLHIAQVLLRAGDARALELAHRVAELASPTGQWPEAIHPRTGGGCMGDGQHAWAAAEWILFLRHLFVREEGDRLILAEGVDPAWIGKGEVRFGPTPTPYGLVTVAVTGDRRRPVVTCRSDWRQDPPRIEVRLRGFAPREIERGSNHVELVAGDPP